MRLIDADDLLEIIEKYCGDYDCHDNESFDKQAVRMAIRSAPTITPQNEWISVDKRLPDEHAQVLIWSAKWNIAEAGSYYNQHFWVHNEIGDGFIADNITHWMPLPTPPDCHPPERKDDT